MIQKRFQYYSAEGVIWSNWFDFTEHDDLLECLQKKENRQLGKLKNEYRYANKDK